MEITALAADYTAQMDAVAGSLTLTALIGMLPLVTFFILLGPLKRPAWQSAMGAVVTALIIAVIGFSMPVGLALLSLTQGMVFGLFPIVWIVLAAIWIYELTVVSGRFEDMRRVFSAVGHGDMRIQAMLIAFCFGGLLEALAGFGAPVAITGAMLLALGMKPLKAAVVVLIANTAPVAFGAMAIPITTAGNLTGIPPQDIAAIVGRQTPLLAFAVPLLLVFLVDGRRGLKQTWPVALATGVAFAISQYWSANHFSYELTDVVSALVGLAVAVGMLRFWKPVTPPEQASQIDENAEPLTGGRVWWSLFPYLLVIVVFGIAKLWTAGIDVPAWLASTDLAIQWPGLHGHILDDSGQAVSSTIYKFTWLSNPGTLLVLSGILVALVYSLVDEHGRYAMSFGRGIAEFFHICYRMRISALTIATVLGLAYVMNLSGQTVAIGVWMAAAGGIFALLSPTLGWIGTAVTGSDTSANALFAKLQQTAGVNAGINPDLLVAANTSGGVVGKLVSPQNLTIAATAVGMPGSERDLLRAVVKYSLIMLAILCVIVFLQSTAVLGWMLP